MIDRSAGEPKMFSEPVYVEFSADYTENLENAFATTEQKQL
jgi:hypothetical protein